MRYLIVWTLAVAADWVQGPYAYALYASYGFTTAEIARLFVVGFGTAMACGSFMGTIADTWGRRRCALLHCAFYVAGCLAKHCDVYHVLVFGRVCDGIASSLFFSAFECWMVAEHRHRYGFSEDLLQYMFSITFFVQYLTAIAAGLVAQMAADAFPLQMFAGATNLHYGGYVAPFELSIGLLLIAGFVICFSWDENYGTSDKQSDRALSSSLQAVGSALRSGSRVLLIGAVVSAFEGSTMVFVFNWTPALDSKNVPLRHGLIFSEFMMTCLCGAIAFGMLGPSVRPGKVLAMACVVAMATFGTMAFYIGNKDASDFIFLGFLLFEACVGFYFPAMGMLKSQEVPEEARAGMYSLYRIPLNAVVISLLLTDMELGPSFGVCAFFLAVAVAALLPFISERSRQLEDNCNTQSDVRHFGRLPLRVGDNSIMCEDMSRLVCDIEQGDAGREKGIAWDSSTCSTLASVNDLADAFTEVEAFVEPLHQAWAPIHPSRSPLWTQPMSQLPLVGPDASECGLEE
eukprot:CAMPEP_0117535728 /NCGR_PEP_ID=MMETSP0784-20121206/41084_1 /TAXON_ID=39447 /ORGANISM="" /LENGTH=515 /DNA_ID=CAMNT_0005332263 /DNA_START=102 /DNA_END=1649 /DNA_ORIENTATION=-